MREWVRHPRNNKILLYTLDISKYMKFCDEAGLLFQDVQYIFGPGHLDNFDHPVTLYVYGTEIMQDAFYDDVVVHLIRNGGDVVYLSEVPA